MSEITPVLMYYEQDWKNCEIGVRRHNAEENEALKDPGSERNPYTPGRGTRLGLIVVKCGNYQREKKG